MEENKNAEIIKKFQFEVGKEAMALFYALELKDGMDSLIINDTNGDEFKLSFKRVKNNVVLDDVIVVLPFEFVEWYSGMEKEKIERAYERYLKEKGN